MQIGRSYQYFSIDRLERLAALRPELITSGVRAEDSRQADCREFIEKPGLDYRQPSIILNDVVNANSVPILSATPITVTGTASKCVLNSV